MSEGGVGPAGTSAGGKATPMAARLEVRQAGFDAGQLGQVGFDLGKTRQAGVD